MATQDAQTLVHTDTQVHEETLRAGKEVGPRVTWAGQALSSGLKRPTLLRPRPSPILQRRIRLHHAHVPPRAQTLHLYPTSLWPVHL